MNDFKLPTMTQGRGVALRPNTALDEYTQEQLVELRLKIDEMMPIRRIKDVNLEQELVLQMQCVQRLQANVLDDELTPANQRAQVAGAVASSLRALGALQIEIYSSERLKRIEAILIEVINEMPLRMQELFFKRYEIALGKT